MKRYITLFMSTLLGIAVMTAAPEIIRGTVTDSESGEPLPGVVVQSINEASKSVSFSSTKADGSFTLNVKSGVSVTFRCMGYETLSMKVTDDFASVKMSPKATQLRDVIIKAPDISQKGDTLVYNVDKFAKQQDDAIIDVIKRLPGIKVDDDGTIMYNGKPINKFYIDGNDFIGGQYGLATNNLSKDDVKSVEVLENHQPIKALDDIEFSDQAGINLKLKEDARQKWVGVAQGAAGFSPMLYDASLFTMRIASKIQNMFTLKVDNTGWDPSTQIIEHDYEMLFDRSYDANIWSDYISADAVSIPLADRRTRDNLSMLANAITAWRTGDTSMRLKLNYSGDRLDYSSGVITDYFSSDIPDFVQNKSLRTSSHDVTAQLNSEVNKSEYYLKNKLVADALWRNSDSGVSGSYSLGQRVKRRTLSVVDDLRLVKRNDKRLVTVSSRNSVNHNPQELNVTGDEINADQWIHTTDVRSTTEVKYGRFFGRWKLYTSGGVDLNYHRLKSSLTGRELPVEGDGHYNAFVSGVYVTPQLDYDYRSFNLSIWLPVKWRHYSIAGNRDFVDVSPRVWVRKQIGAKSEFSASVAYAMSSPSAEMFVDTPFMLDSRNIYRAVAMERYTNSSSASLTYKYRNPLSAFFANISGSFQLSRAPFMSNQLFTGDFIVSTYSPMACTSRIMSLSGGLSKGVGHGRLVMGIDASMNHVTSATMREGGKVPYKQWFVSVNPYVKGNIVRWLSMAYDMHGQHNSFAIEGEPPSHVNSFNHSLSLTVLPNDYWMFTAGCEHYYTGFAEGNHSNLVLFDASVVWQITGRTRLSLTASNLLDERSYRYMSYGTLSQSEYAYRIRPRNVLASVQVRF
ncbi:carboxypeptidase regulatory-like domain-containing protein [uncultured Muribaculum sp.]|uniref:carboxypeptidase regulatory-like domain-containing protein n=3 Tax=uncultured Muribaculum sp. TaxID=1918613 RepID=UPI0025A2AF7E|nr:carboxypeptidase regulatory-like domain-containing protein [uncultured Muribaculum sp.]